MSRMLLPASDPIDTTPPLGLPASVSGVGILANGPPSKDGTLLLASHSEPRLQFLVEGRSQPVDIDHYPFYIGRAPGCGLVLHDRTVSRRHARIERISDAYFIQDLNSSNGVVVNGQSVDRSLLVAGDVVRLGSACLCCGAVSGAERRVELPERRRGGMAPRLAAVVLAVSAAIVTGAWFYADRGGATGPAAVGTEAGVTSAANDGGSLVMDSADEWMRSPTTGLQVSDLLAAQAPSALSKHKRIAVLHAHRKHAVAHSDAKPRPRDSIVAAAKRHPSRDQASKDRSTDAVRGRRSETAHDVAKAAADERAAPMPKPESLPRAANGLTDARVSRAARGVYLQGRGERALELLRTALAEPGSGPERARIAELEAGLDRLLRLDREALHAYRNGHSEVAFARWVTFLDAERLLFLEQRSRYADVITARVVAEYHRLGQIAYEEQRFQDAYRLWERAEALDSESEAARALDHLRRRAQALFRDGYRIETADLPAAKRRWREVLAIAPAGSEYHVKARAKLAWYERFDR